MIPNKDLSIIESEELFKILRTRFEKNIHRHKDIEWIQLEKKLRLDTNNLWSLYEMEKTGGEPDVVNYDNNTGEYIFYDCSIESPKGRRSICYDREAQESRKEYKPENSAIDMASFMGIDILDEEQYRYLQQIGEFDTKTSSWIKTPPQIRKLGGAVFCDRRYDHIFIYHNSAESYYANRGFRGLLRI